MPPKPKNNPGHSIDPGRGLVNFLDQKNHNRRQGLSILSKIIKNNENSREDFYSLLTAIPQVELKSALSLPVKYISEAKKDQVLESRLAEDIYLKLHKKQRGIIQLIGKSGMGKTTVCKLLIEKNNISSVKKNIIYLEFQRALIKCFLDKVRVARGQQGWKLQTWVAIYLDILKEKNSKSTVETQKLDLETIYIFDNFSILNKSIFCGYDQEIDSILETIQVSFEQKNKLLILITVDSERAKIVDNNIKDDIFDNLTIKGLSKKTILNELLSSLNKHLIMKDETILKDLIEDKLKIHKNILKVPFNLRLILEKYDKSKNDQLKNSKKNKRTKYSRKKNANNRVPSLPKKLSDRTIYYKTEVNKLELLFKPTIFIKSIILEKLRNIYKQKGEINDKFQELKKISKEYYLEENISDGIRKSEVLNGLCDFAENNNISHDIYFLYLFSEWIFEYFFYNFDVNQNNKNLEDTLSKLNIKQRDIIFRNIVYNLLNLENCQDLVENYLRFLFDYLNKSEKKLVKIFFLVLDIIKEKFKDLSFISVDLKDKISDYLWKNIQILEHSELFTKFFISISKRQSILELIFNSENETEYLVIIRERFIYLLKNNLARLRYLDSGKVLINVLSYIPENAEVDPKVEELKTDLVASYIYRSYYNEAFEYCKEFGLMSSSNTRALYVASAAARVAGEYEQAILAIKRALKNLIEGYNKEAKAVILYNFAVLKFGLFMDYFRRNLLLKDDLINKKEFIFHYIKQIVYDVYESLHWTDIKYDCILVLRCILLLLEIKSIILYLENDLKIENFSQSETFNSLYPRIIQAFILPTIILLVFQPISETRYHIFSQEDIDIMNNYCNMKLKNYKNLNNSLLLSLFKIKFLEKKYKIKESVFSEIYNYINQMVSHSNKNDKKVQAIKKAENYYKNNSENFINIVIENSNSDISRKKMSSNKSSVELFDKMQRMYQIINDEPNNLCMEIGKLSNINYFSFVNLRFNQGYSLLHYAVIRGDVKGVISLVENHTYISCRDNNGFTPLALAIYYRQNSIIQYLLSQSRFSLYAFDAQGYSPLHVCAYMGNYVVTGYLIKSFRYFKNNYLDIKDNHEYSAADYAKDCEYHDIVRVINSFKPDFKKNIDLDKPNIDILESIKNAENIETIVDIFKSLIDMENLKMLKNMIRFLRKVKKNYYEIFFNPKGYENSILHIIASKAYNKELFNCIISFVNKDDLNFDTNNSWWSPMHRAAVFGNWQFINNMFEKFSKIKDRFLEVRSDTWTVLHEAALCQDELGSLRVFLVILNASPEIARRLLIEPEENGFTPLHFLEIKKYYNVIDYIFIKFEDLLNENLLKQGSLRDLIKKILDRSNSKKVSLGFDKILTLKTAKVKNIDIKLSEDSKFIEKENFNKNYKAIYIKSKSNNYFLLYDLYNFDIKLFILHASQSGFKLFFEEKLKKNFKALSFRINTKKSLKIIDLDGQNLKLFGITENDTLFCLDLIRGSKNLLDSNEFDNINCFDIFYYKKEIILSIGYLNGIIKFFSIIEDHRTIKFEKKYLLNDKFVINPPDYYELGPIKNDKSNIVENYLKTSIERFAIQNVCIRKMEDNILYLFVRNSKLFLYRLNLNDNQAFSIILNVVLTNKNAFCLSQNTPILAYCEENKLKIIDINTNRYMFILNGYDDIFNIQKIDISDDENYIVSYYKTQNIRIFSQIESMWQLCYKIKFPDFFPLNFKDINYILNNSLIFLAHTNNSSIFFSINNENIKQIVDCKNKEILIEKINDPTEEILIEAISARDNENYFNEEDSYLIINNFENFIPKIYSFNNLENKEEFFEKIIEHLEKNHNIECSFDNFHEAETHAIHLIAQKYSLLTYNKELLLSIFKPNQLYICVFNCSHKIIFNLKDKSGLFEKITKYCIDFYYVLESQSKYQIPCRLFPIFYNHCDTNLYNLLLENKFDLFSNNKFIEKNKIFITLPEDIISGSFFYKTSTININQVKYCSGNLSLKPGVVSQLLKKILKNVDKVNDRLSLFSYINFLEIILDKYKKNKEYAYNAKYLLANYYFKLKDYVASIKYYKQIHPDVRTIKNKKFILNDYINYAIVLFYCDSEVKAVEFLEDVQNYFKEKSKIDEDCCIFESKLFLNQALFMRYLMLYDKSSTIIDHALNTIETFCLNNNHYVEVIKCNFKALKTIFYNNIDRSIEDLLEIINNMIYKFRDNHPLCIANMLMYIGSTYCNYIKSQININKGFIYLNHALNIVGDLNFFTPVMIDIMNYIGLFYFSEKHYEKSEFILTEALIKCQNNISGKNIFYLKVKANLLFVKIYQMFNVYSYKRGYDFNKYLDLILNDIEEKLKDMHQNKNFVSTKLGRILNYIDNFNQIKNNKNCDFYLKCFLFVSIYLVFIKTDKIRLYHPCVVESAVTVWHNLSNLVYKKDCQIFKFFQNIKMDLEKKNSIFIDREILVDEIYTDSHIGQFSISANEKNIQILSFINELNDKKNVSIDFLHFLNQLPKFNIIKEYTKEKYQKNISEIDCLFLNIKNLELAFYYDINFIFDNYDEGKEKLLKSLTMYCEYLVLEKRDSRKAKYILDFIGQNYNFLKKYNSCLKNAALKSIFKLVILNAAAEYYCGEYKNSLNYLILALDDIVLKNFEKKINKKFLLNRWTALGNCIIGHIYLLLSVDKYQLEISEYFYHISLKIFQISNEKNKKNDYKEYFQAVTKSYGALLCRKGEEEKFKEFECFIKNNFNTNSNWKQPLELGILMFRLENIFYLCVSDKNLIEEIKFDSNIKDIDSNLLNLESDIATWEKSKKYSIVGMFYNCRGLLNFLLSNEDSLCSIDALKLALNYFAMSKNHYLVAKCYNFVAQILILKGKTQDEIAEYYCRVVESLQKGHSSISEMNSVRLPRLQKFFYDKLNIKTPPSSDQIFKDFTSPSP